MAKTILCRSATPFTTAGELDENALRRYLQRLVDAKVGVYLGNPGCGEGHALTNEEFNCLYKIGVEVCRGKVPVYANPPEQPTARDTREQVRIAVDAGVELVNLYGPSGRHGYKPTDGELLAYFDDVLSAVRHPVALAPDPTTGYTAKAEIIAEVCEKYPQVQAVNLGDTGEDYLIALKDMLKRDVDLFVLSPSSLRALDLGAAGVLSAEANIIPNTCRGFLDSYEKDRASNDANIAYLHLRRFVRYVSQWGPSNVRWIKMCMKLLKLPGGEGGVREPYQLPPPEEIQKFASGLLKLGIPEIEEQARAAGLRVAA